MKAVLNLVDQVSVWAGKISSVLTLLVAMLVVYEVVMRYVFHLPTLWVSESLGIGCALMYLFGGAWVIEQNKHVRIDTLYERMSPRVQSAMDAATYIFFALYTGIMAYTASKYAWTSFLLRETSGSPWDPPIYPIKFALALGFVMLLLQGTAKFLRDLHFMGTGREL